MNIFFVHQNPIHAARSLTNAHVRSQLRESVIMLVTAHHIHDNGKSKKNYPEPSHFNHPMTKWVAAHDDNYRWLHNHLKELCKEYKFRHGVPHYMERYVLGLHEAPNKIDRRSGWQFTVPLPPVVVSPDLKPDLLEDEDLTWDMIVDAYRKYYIRDKKHLHHWMMRDPPAWIPQQDAA